MAYSARTDLAIEAREMYFENSNIEAEVPGVEVENEDVSNYIKVTRVKISSDEGSRTLGKSVGNYVTLEIPNRFYGQHEVYEEVCQACAKELSQLIKLGKDDDVLVIGLGNWNITADALGPKVISSLMITRHLKKYIPEEIDEGVRPVCAIAPGVLGITGIETGEIVKGLVEKVGPKLVIVIDALCSRKMERINTTIQISDTGITPGAGVGNRRMAIDKGSLGVPVIAIGIPTVVDAATIAGETIDLIVNDLKENARENEPLYKMLSTIQEEDKYAMIKQVLSPGLGDFIVTPKEVDSIVIDLSSVIANGINIALHEGITLQDVDKYK